MTRPHTKPEEHQPYQNDYRLIQTYQEATSLDDEGLEALCPSYIELSENSTRYQNEDLLGKHPEKSLNLRTKLDVWLKETSVKVPKK
ncbi:MAG: hypothetical protein ABF379_06745 [Akkermansiaceae bacterium]